MENIDNTVQTEAVEKTTPVDQDKIAAAKKKVEEFSEETKNKVYPVKIDTYDNLEMLRSFIKNDAVWNNMEALGIIELNKQLEKQEVKNGNIFLKALEVDAINHFLSKVEGNGLESAINHITLMKAVNGALTLVKADTNMMNQLLVELDAAEHGIEVEPTPTK